MVHMVITALIGRRESVQKVFQSPSGSPPPCLRMPMLCTEEGTIRGFMSFVKQRLTTDGLSLTLPICFGDTDVTSMWNLCFQSSPSSTSINMCTRDMTESPWVLEGSRIRSSCILTHA